MLYLNIIFEQWKVDHGSYQSHRLIRVIEIAGNIGGIVL